jgi:D-alanine-D-alanine ligase
MAKKIRVGVLMGGPAAEREISLVTGKAVCENLDKKKYEVLPIEMSKKGQLFLNNKYYFKLNNYNKKTKVNKELISLENKVGSKNKIDMIFIAMHGPYGEDGCVQGMLESLGIKYTGSGVLASAIGMNKAKAAEIYQQNNLTTPKYVDFTNKEWKQNKQRLIKEIKNKIKFPLVIKPVDQGSSVGTYLVKKEKDLANKINSSFLYSKWIMAQKFIKGREMTCGVIEKNGENIATPVTEIIANAGEFYDLASKYDAGGSTHVCPAKISTSITKKIQDIALKAHRTLGCRGMSRTDVFVGNDKKLYVIETNTIPGMTPTSLLPEAVGKMGIDFTKMLDLIIKASL